MLISPTMTVTMIKKRLADGSTCKKCIEAEALLKRRGAWGFVDAVVWAVEDDPKSEGMRLAERHGIETAPFFLVGASGFSSAGSISLFSGREPPR